MIESAASRVCPGIRARCLLLTPHPGPILLGSSATPGTAMRDWNQLPKHKDEDQVRVDVNRSFIYYPNSTPYASICIHLVSSCADLQADESEKQLDRRKEELSDIITEVLRRHPMLSYFQGFHDIVQVMLLVLGKDLAVDAVTRLSLLRIRDFMLPSLSASLAHLKLLPAILYAADAKLCQHLSRTQPFFALAATLTLYAHEIQDYGAIARLFDFLLAQEAVVSIYLFAVIILSRKDELLEIPADEPEMLHFTLSKLPNPLAVEDLIKRANGLFSKHPPEQLPFRAWSRISPYSVLKTTRGCPRTQSISEGEELFTEQVSQIQREEFRQRARSIMWKYRKPAGGIGLALIVGLASILIQRAAPDGAQWLGMRKVWYVVRYLGG